MTRGRRPPKLAAVQERGDVDIATAPSRSRLAGEAPGAAPAVLQWVFPSVARTPLDRAGAIGRDAACMTQLVGAEVSRHHAHVELEGRLAVLVDRGSRNGISVGGRRVAQAPLAVNDVVRIGEWVGVVVAGEDAGPVEELAPGWLGGPALARVVESARRVAATSLPVVVQGETGTGKEGLARAIHAWSRRSGALVPVNCAAVAPTLIEAELFGYRRGAFTGADRASPGLVRAADRGTLLLDEVADLPLDGQAKLLRVLEQREIQPLGAVAPVRVDVRFVAAAQRPLADEVAAERFRADLHARLDGITLVLPPLRDRRADVAAIFAHALREATGGRPPRVDARVIERLCLYDWPRNVRELAQLARRLVALHPDAPALLEAHLPESLRVGVRGPSSAPRTPAAPAAPAPPPDEQLPRLLDALRANGGNLLRAAEAVGISRFRAYRLLRASPETDWKRTREGS